METNKEEEYEFEDKPASLQCKYCQKHGETTITFIPSPLSFLLLTLVLINLGFLVTAICILPIIVLTAHKSHKCPSCFNVLGKSTRIFNYGISLKDRVIPLNIGSDLGILASIRLLLNIALVIVIIINFLWRVSGIDAVAGVPIDTSWDDFLKECGAQNFGREAFGNVAIRSKLGHCEMKYLGRTFQNWKGHVIRIEDNRKSRFDFFHAVKILIKMDPPEFEDRTDVVLFLNKDKIKLFGDQLELLDHGKEIIFNATLKSLMITRGNHLHVMNITVGEGFKELPEILHENSRFEFKGTKKFLTKERSYFKKTQKKEKKVVIIDQEGTELDKEKDN